MSRSRFVLISILFSLVLIQPAFSAKKDDPTAPQRLKAKKLAGQGNWKEAYEVYAKLARDPKDNPRLVGSDLTQALQCLRNINRINEIDAFREEIIKIHSKNWRLLQTAANTYLGHGYYNHSGFMVAGE